MATADKDLEALRAEHKQLSDNLTRSGLLILTILCLLVISFARACKKASGAEVKTTLCQIEKIGKTSKQDRNVSYMFELFDTPSECEEPCATPSPSLSPSPNPTAATSKVVSTPKPSPTPSPPETTPSLTPSPLPDSSLSVTAQTANSPSPTPEELQPSPEPLPTRHEPTEAEQKVARDCQAKLEAGLEDSAQNWFGVEAPIPGVKIKVDLRYWIFILPPLFFLSGIYLHALRKKLDVIRAVAAHRLSLAKPEEITQVDRLYWHYNPAYARSPSHMAATLFVACYLFLPVYVIYAGASFWTYWDTSLLVGIGFVLSGLTLYSFSYAHLLTNRFNREIARITNLPLRRNIINVALERSKLLIQRVAQRLSPRIPLSIGGVLVLITLLLTISQSGCDHKTYKGYQVLLGEKGAYWYPSFALLGDTNTFNSNIGRITYGMALLLALLVLVLIAVPRLYSKVGEERLRKPLLGLAGAIFVVSTIDFSVSAGVYPVWEGATRLTLCAIFTGLWTYHSFSSQQSKRQKWARIRSPLLVFSTPFLVMAFLFAFQNLVGLPGLMAYFVGITLLFLGLTQLQYRLSPLHVAIEPPAEKQPAAEDPLMPLA